MNEENSSNEGMDSMFRKFPMPPKLASMDLTNNGSPSTSKTLAYDLLQKRTDLSTQKQNG